MAFQPFGYHFEVRSALSPAAAKAAVRARWKGWFDMGDGARGWIIGPIICLQRGAGRSAPSLMGIISRDEFGTRISGRAGYPGSIVVLGLIPVLGYGLHLSILDPRDASGYLPIHIFIIALISLVLWLSDKYGHNAEPLVKFLRDAVGNPDHSRKAQSAMPKLAAKFPKSLALEIDGSVPDDPVTPASVRDALSEIEGGGFVILSLAEETFIQGVGGIGGYILEKREGDDQHFYRAVRHGAAQADDAETFTFEETLAVFIAYGSKAPMPSFLEWKAARP